MKKTNKLIVTTGILIATALGIFGTSNIQNITLLKSNVNSDVKAYNYNPTNILDNVFEKDGMTILPFIFENPDVTISKSYVKNQFERAGHTVKSISCEELVTTGTIIKTESGTYNVVIYGDTDGDGYVDVFDAQAVLRHYVFGGIHELKGTYKIAANVDNEDDEIDVFDAQKILRFYVGYVTKLVENEPISKKEEDPIKPVITLNGNNTVTIKLGETYKDEGATATDNKDGNITSKIKVNSNVNTNKVGTYTVTYTVSDKVGNIATATRKVQVVDYLSKIIVTAPNKVEYKYGEELNLEGLKVQQIMASENKTEVNINDCTINGYNKEKLGEQTVTVEYGGKEATFKVNVSNYIKAIEIEELPTKLTYIDGQSLDLTGIKINAVMADGTRKEISSLDENLTINPKETINYPQNKVELTYSTTNSIDDNLTELTTIYEIETKKKMESLVVGKEKENGYANEKFTYGTIIEGDYEEELDISKTTIQYQVFNESNEDITNLNLINIVVEEELVRPGENLIKVTAKEAGIYKFILLVETSEGKTIKTTEQIIEITEDPSNNIVSNIGLKNIETAIIKPNKAFVADMNIINAKGNTIEYIVANTIEVNSTDLEISLLKDGNPISNNQEKVNQIQIIAKSEGEKEISITVNKGLEEETTIKVKITVQKADIELNINNIKEIKLYSTQQEDTNVVTIGDYVYTLVPISLTGTDTTIKGNDIPENLTYKISNNDMASIYVQLFNENKVVTNTGDTAVYIGFALGKGYSEAKLNGETITLTYGISSKVIKINNN